MYVKDLDGYAFATIRRVAEEDKKNWWRNFVDGGGRVDVDLGGVRYSGLATATRDDRGRVSVDITVDH